MPNLKKVYGGKVETYIDAATGEVLARKDDYKFTLGDEESYVKLYSDNIRFLLNLPRSNLNVLLLIFEVVDYSNRGGYVMLPAGRKKEFCKVLDISLSALNSVLSELIKTKILVREGLGVYKLNPWLFGKGAWTDIVEEREHNKSLYDDIHGKRNTDYRSKKGDNL